MPLIDVLHQYTIYYPCTPSAVKAKESCSEMRRCRNLSREAKRLWERAKDTRHQSDKGAQSLLDQIGLECVPGQTFQFLVS